MRNRTTPSICLIMVAWLSSGPLLAADGDQPDRSALPIQLPPAKVRLAPTEDESEQYFQAPVSAPEGAPNILLVMTDDVGFGSSSTFGGLVPTPNLDQLAAQGLRYNRFHTTGICSPTRASLLTGRNHHAVSAATVVEMATPYPGYASRIPRSAATIARILRDNGYNTAMLGKDHNVPAGERSPSGPFDQWPTGRGFEYFYGFIAGDTDQWHPALYEGTEAVDGRGRPDDYLLDRELADQAIRWIHNQKASAPDKPFFLYLATGSSHAPHQAPPEWIEKFRGQFDEGWDKARETILAQQKALGVVPADTQLPPRPPQVEAWYSLTGKQQRVFARFMEVYAAMLSYQDAQFGRVWHELQRMGIDDNTLVVFIQGDNGSSGEGGLEGTLNELMDLSSPGKHDIDVDWLADHLDILGGKDTYQGYPVGWTYATNTPFPWFKTHASHLGGVRNGLVISWPGHIKSQGEVRSQYHHVIDIMPTLLDAAGIPAPGTVDGVPQQRIDGVSMAYSFDDAKAISKRQTQYYEIIGNRGIYHDGWLANTTPRNMPWNIAKVRDSSDPMSYEWELYNLNEDYSQSHNLAKQDPEKLQQMQALFDREARANNVYPIQDAGGMARAMKMMRKSGAVRTQYVYWGPDISVQLMSAPMIFHMPFEIEAEIEVGEQANGVIVAAGSYFGGWSFYLDQGVPVAVASKLPVIGAQATVRAEQPLSAGKHTLRFEFDESGLGGDLEIYVDGEQVATGHIEQRPLIMAGNGETFDTGRDTNVPVTEAYSDGGVFEGTIDKVTVKLNPTLRQAFDFIKGALFD